MMDDKTEYLRAAEALERHEKYLPSIAWEAYYMARRGADLSVHQADIEAARLLRECVARNDYLK